MATGLVRLAPTGLVRLAPVFNQAVEKSLRGILGDVAAKAIETHLRQRFSLSRQDYFNQVVTFTSAIRAIFERSSGIIERAIAKRFYAKLGLAFTERTPASLVDYVDAVVLNRAVKAESTFVVIGGMTETVNFSKEMKPTEHVILFYSEPELKRQLLFSYLKEGLDKGEAATYVASQETPDEIKMAMFAFGIDVERLERSGALRVIPYTQWYYLEGHFDEARTMQLWQKLYDDVMAKEFKGLRVTGETHCFFEHGHVAELAAYEKSLHREVELPMAVICAYDVNEVPAQTLYDLIAAHSNSLFLGPELQLVSSEPRITEDGPW